MPPPVTAALTWLMLTGAVAMMNPPVQSSQFPAAGDRHQTE